MKLDAELMAKLFHETYERLAPDFDYETRKSSAKPWFEVPENNRNLMVAVASEVLSVQDRMADADHEETAEALMEDFEDATNALFQALTKPKGVRQRFLRWLYPELVEVSESLRKCYWTI